MVGAAHQQSLVRTVPQAHGLNRWPRNQNAVNHRPEYQAVPHEVSERPDGVCMLGRPTHPRYFSLQFKDAFFGKCRQAGARRFDSPQLGQAAAGSLRLAQRPLGGDSGE
ncbi:hypothetical protein PJL18_01624 [Paenarthrobacter nicotinovorans]|nr:hypothetical protein [Paenarthrobacter nicotinovorans]